MPAPARHHASDAPAISGTDGERLDDRLLAGLEQDDRLTSGLNGLPQADELEFIQMTGITRTRSVSQSLSSARDEPLSFYEAGIADVDERMAPGGIPEPGELGGSVPAGAPRRPRSAEALRELIVELRPDVVSARSASEDTLAEESPQSVSTGPENPGEEKEPYAGLVTGMPGVGPLGEASMSGAVRSDFGEAFAPETDMDTPALEDVPEASALDALVALLGGSDRRDAPAEGPVCEDTGDTLDLPTADEALGEADAPASPRHDSADPEDAGSDTPPEFSPTPEARLAQAEELLRALESQPRHGPDDAPAEPFSWPAADMEDAFDREVEGSLPVRRGGRLAGLLILLFAGTLLAGGVWGFLYHAAPRTVGTSGDEPDAESLFQAAVATQLEPAADEGAAQERDRRALGLFEAFAGAYPAHPKAPRARVLMGVLQHRLGDNAQAVRTLTPFLQAGPPGPDPEGWAPAMRTLARSLARLGRYSEAAETYRAAVASPSNTTPEVDYEELGSLMLEWAAANGDDADRELLLRAAAEYWGLALAVPGIDPLERARIREQRDALLEQLRGPEESGAAHSPAIPGESPEE